MGNPVEVIRTYNRINFIEPPKTNPTLYFLFDYKAQTSLTTNESLHLN